MRNVALASGDFVGQGRAIAAVDRCDIPKRQDQGLALRKNLSFVCRGGCPRPPPVGAKFIGVVGNADPYKIIQKRCKAKPSHTHQSGCICVPANAAATAGESCSHTATSELGFFAASSCAIGTK